MEKIETRIRFDKSGYFFIGLLILAILGFWNSYFLKFFTGKNQFLFYFHFHAIMMSLWVLLLITQPLLVRNKKVTIHRLIGKATYFIMPLLLISVLLVLNSRLRNTPVSDIKFSNFLVVFRDILLLITAFSIGIYHRHNFQIHARAMIITGIVFIEPALSRFLSNVVFKENGLMGGFVTIALMLGLIITLIIIERKQKSGRWLFPPLLAIYITVYAILVFQIPLTILDPIAIWFAGLPLT